MNHSRLHLLLSHLFQFYARYAPARGRRFTVGWILKRLRGKSLLVRYGKNQLILIDPSDYLQFRILVAGYYEPVIVDYLEKNLSPHAVFWDVGANIGSISLIAAKHASKVIAFEPEPKNAFQLCRNFQLNDLKNVQHDPSAVGDRVGTADLSIFDDCNRGMHSIMRSVSGTSITVPLVTVDEFVRLHPELEPTAMKIDVEGAESAVFNGARETLAKGIIDWIIFEAPIDFPDGELNSEIATILNDAGYSIRVLGGSDPNLHSDHLTNFIAERSNVQTSP